MELEGSLPYSQQLHSPVLSQMNPVYDISPCFVQVHFNIANVCMHV
jgi:hypothetical protein